MFKNAMLFTLFAQLSITSAFAAENQQEVQFKIQMGTSDLQNAENVRSQSKVGTSDLHNAENVRSQAKRKSPPADMHSHLAK